MRRIYYENVFLHGRSHECHRSFPFQREVAVPLQLLPAARLAQGSALRASLESAARRRAPDDQHHFLALFFSWIYLLTLGMWRKALVVIAIFIGLFALAFVLPTILVQGLIGGFCALLAHCTNYGYYLEQVKGRASWNPFDGFI